MGTTAELISRGPMSPEQSSRHERLADLLKPPDPADEPPLRRPVIFGVLGVLMLLGTSAVSAAIIARPATAPRPVVSAAPIEGVLALRPDLVRDARWPFTANGGFAAAAHSSHTTAEPKPVERVAANPSAGSHDSALNVVAEFYRRLEGAPDKAVSLLSPELLSGQQAELVQAWHDVESVQPQVRGLPDGAVQVDVEAGYPGGRRVVLRQLLTVEPGTYPKIVGAELLSARHVVPR